MTNRKQLFYPMRHKLSVLLTLSILMCLGPSAFAGPVICGADRLFTEYLHLIQGRKVALVSNHSGVLADGTHLADTLHAHPEIKLRVLFGMEFNIRSNDYSLKRDAEAEIDLPTGLLKYSLYGHTHKPTPEMFGDTEVVIFDMQDVGARFYEHINILGYVMEAAAENGLRMIVLDRPNPITGMRPDGFVTDPDFMYSFGSYARIPVRHAMTIGELANMYLGEGLLRTDRPLDLHVIPLQGWSRHNWMDETGLPWKKPSPNLPGLSSVLAYTGTCLFEGFFNVSEGRGTTNPFEYIGAPWMDAPGVARLLESLQLPGVDFVPIEFTPTMQPHLSRPPKLAEQLCAGIHVRVSDRNVFQPYRAGIALLWAIYKLHGSQLEWRESSFTRLTANHHLLPLLHGGKTPAEIFAAWEDELAAFQEIRSRYLLYPESKPALDEAAYADWEIEVPYPQLSSDGRYVAYAFRDGDRHAGLTVRQVDGSNQHVQIDGGLPGFVFTEDGHHLLFRQEKTTLKILDLLSGAEQVLAEVDTFCYRHPYLMYNSVSQPDEWTIRHLWDARSLVLDRVSKAVFSADGATSFLVRKLTNGEKAVDALIQVDLETMQWQQLWSGSPVLELVLGHTGTYLAWLADTADQPALWYLGPAGDQPKQILLDKETISLQIDIRPPHFSRDHSRLFYWLKEPPAGPPQTETVIIWSWADSLYQREPRMPRGLARPGVLAAYDTQQDRAWMVHDLTEETVQISDTASWVLIKKRFKTDRFWDPSIGSNYLLVSLNEGKRIILPEAFSHYDTSPQLSPDGRFVINYHPGDQHYHAFDIAGKKSYPISQAVPWPLFDDQIERLQPRPYGIAGWDVSGLSVLVYDQYDIWSLSLLGDRPPRNLTEGEGRGKELIFSRVVSNPAFSEASVADSMLLTGFSRQDKTNGFWMMPAGGGMPVMRTQSAHVYHIGRVQPVGFEFPGGALPKKAKKAEVYLVRRESSGTFPNWYITTDFTHYQPVTDIAPERRYNWYTTELHHWISTKGVPLQGILYRPENFDPSIKYPLIFHYYQRKSDRLNEYLVPAFSGATLDIPTYVSNGYLVFVPDIYYRIGEGNGAGAYESVVSAARYLSRFSWVDTARMGLQAHSHGGYQTNYLLVHTDLFAAACESAGTSNTVSSYGQLTGHGASRQPGGEIGFQGAGFGIGQTPWTAPHLYVESSPVFGIARVTTPLLIMHGNADTAVPFEQSIEFFTGLRRAGKPAWLLEYPGAGHTLNGMQSRDFTRRMRAFFDYYLQNKPKPDWMVGETTTH